MLFAGMKFYFYSGGKFMESKFSGGLLGLIGTNIIVFLLSVCTLGLAVPWGVCIKQGWIAKHTILEGRQMYFDGNGAQLFGNYIKWFLLSIITLGIYTLWLSINIRKWVTKHTHLY